VPDAATLLARLDSLHRHLLSLHANATRQRMQRADRAFLRLQALRPQVRLETLAQRARLAHAQLANAMQRRLERERAGLRHADAILRATHPQRRLQQARARLNAMRGRPQASLAQRLQREAVHLRGLVRSLHAISPLATVARGYSILQHADGRIVRNIDDVAIDECIDARLHDGRLRLRVEAREPVE
jgi:exodeoxyribonuclease VII large subunit